jgi:hypothetical protein
MCYNFIDFLLNIGDRNMKYIYRYLLVCLAALLFNGAALSVIAQQDDTCPADTHQAWLDVANSIFGAYTQLASQSSDIATVAQLQDQRRQLDQTPRPSCDDQGYEALRGALDLAADSMVASLNKNDTLAQTLLTQANAKSTSAASIIVVTPAPSTSSTDNVTAITSPKKGAEAPYTQQVTGTLDPQQVGDNDLWLFVVDPAGIYYPQVNNACSDRRSTIIKTRHNTWSMPTYFGAQDGNHGDVFGLDLMMGNADATQALYAMFTDWCSNNNFTGLTEADITQLNLTDLDYIEVTRR